MYAVDNGVPDLHDRPLPLTAQPEVTILHQKIHSMFFLCNRVFFSNMNDLNLSYLYFIAADLLFILFYFSFNCAGRFKSQFFCIFKTVSVHFCFRYNALAHTTAISQDDEENSLPGSLVRNPSLESNFATLMQ